jgi:hypothetical protein
LGALAGVSTVARALSAMRGDRDQMRSMTRAAACAWKVQRASTHGIMASNDFPSSPVLLARVL